MTPLAGLWPPVATPFEASGAVDLSRIVSHSRRLLADGAHGLAVLGTTSEANSLTLDERRQVIDAHVEAGIEPGRLLPGTGASAVDDVVALSRHAFRQGCAGVLMLPPFYYKNVSDDGLFAFFAAVIERLGAEAPRILLYHIPPQTVIGFSFDLVDRLIRAFPGVVCGIKDSSGDWENTRGLIERFPGFAVFPGAESRALEAMQRGAAGCISASANINAKGIRRLLDTWQRPGAKALQDELNAVRKAVESRGLIGAVKAVLAARYDDDAWLRLRPPLMQISEAKRKELLADLAVVNLLNEDKASIA